MMSFICRQCGDCCRGLVFEDHGVKRGLTLFPEEAKRFPDEQIRPYLGLGKRPYDPKFKIIAYQLTADVCPNLKDDKCSDYENRSASCRQYPFSLDPDQEEDTLLGVDMNCPAAVELVNNSDGTIEFSDRDSAERILELKKLAASNPRHAWIYDLGSEKWVCYDRLG